MNRVRQMTSAALALAVLTLGAVSGGTAAQAQTRTYRQNDRQINRLITNIEQNTDRFRASVDAALDRSRYNSTRAEDNINNFIRDFEAATDQLRSRFNGRNAAASDVENVLQRGLYIDDFVRRNRLSARAQNDWSLIRADLTSLASAYNVVWRWDQPIGSVGAYPSAGQVAYRLTDREVDNIITRVEQNGDRFRASVDAALDRTRYNGTRSEDDINRFVRDFEAATDRLRSNFNGRRSVDDDVLGVLSQAASIDTFMRNNRLSNRAQTDWSNLRTDLTTLADAYGVAWNWTNYPTNTYPNTNPSAGTTAYGRLNGTYRLDPTRGDSPRDVAERVTNALPAGDRQRIHDRLLARLEAPEQLAIERRGNSVQIASTRAPQTTFEADGRERTETLPNGRTSRVVSTIVGDRLEVRSTGFRENDFEVTFDPIEQGRRLRVTRRIYSERLTQPVVVTNEYERISDVARFDIYTGTTAGYPSGSTSVSGDFIIRDGERVVAVLDQDLSTRNIQPGERLVLTVREPAQFNGAVIEGTVASVSRGGRITGRSEMSFDFDTIRMRDGRTHSFAGFVESVTTPGGETVRVDATEGTVREDSQTNRTVQRTAIGTAVGAIIGAIAGGGKGAAIGAVVGAAGGAGSVYVQGRDDLELLRGTEFTIRASSPNR